MATKKAGLSDAMSMALIRGERDIYSAEAMKDLAGQREIVQGIANIVGATIQAQQKRNAILEARMEKLGGVPNVNMLDNEKDKKAIASFVRKGRDDFNKASEMYQRTKDPKYLDKMEAIKFSFQNANTQINAYNQDSTEYMDSYSNGELVHLPGDSKYVNMFAGERRLDVASNGDLGFSTGSKGTDEYQYNKYKDIAGKWNFKHYKGNNAVMQSVNDAKTTARKGGTFYRDDYKNNFRSTFQQGSWKEIGVMAKEDITGDDQYPLLDENGNALIGADGNPILSGNQSFESMWQQGYLGEKFYKNFKPTDGTDWMFKRENKEIVNDLLSEYYTDVVEWTYNSNFKKATGNRGAGGNIYVNNREMSPETFQRSFVPFVDKLSKLKNGESISSPTKRKFIKKDGKYYRLTAPNQIDEETGPMDLQQVGTFDGWGQYFDFKPVNENKPKPE